MRRLYLDGDAILWSVLEANQEETWWPGSETTRTAACDVLAAQDMYVDEVERLQEAAKAETVSVVLGPPTREHNFRRALWPKYKMHRRRSDSPVGMFRVRFWLTTEAPFLVHRASPDREADDVLGMLMTQPDDVERVLWSPDKDLLQIPGRHMDDLGHVDLITREAADYHHLFQTLTGDTADGYPGCPGVGPVKAKEILGPGFGWDAVCYAFRKAGLTEQDALLQARIARILRYNEEPGQWNPSPIELRVIA